MLPQDDATYLAERGFDHDVVAEAGHVCVVIRNFPLPPGYDRSRVELLLRLAPGYPDIPPDMWWVSPGVHCSDGSAIAATSPDHHLGRTWQRWSRHLAAGQWQPGRDSLEGFLALIRQDLIKHARPAA